MSNQRERMKRLFMDRQGEWIPLPDILSLYISQYGRVIGELRHIEGMNIENRVEIQPDGSKHSWFCYCPAPAFSREENGQLVMI